MTGFKLYTRDMPWLESFTRDAIDSLSKLDTELTMTQQSLYISEVLLPFFDEDHHSPMVIPFYHTFDRSKYPRVIHVALRLYVGSHAVYLYANGLSNDSQIRSFIERTYNISNSFIGAYFPVLCEESGIRTSGDIKIQLATAINLKLQSYQVS